MHWVLYINLLNCLFKCSVLQIVVGCVAERCEDNISVVLQYRKDDWYV